MDISTKALQTLRMKNVYLENKKELVGQLNKEDKIFYSNWLLSQDEITSYDGVNELKGELSFNSNSSHPVDFQKRLDDMGCPE